MEDARNDARYSVALEGNGARPYPVHVIRWVGDYLGWAETEEEAWTLATVHYLARLHAPIRWQCGYCLGEVVWDDQRIAWVHLTDGARVTPNGPGDMVSARHNVAGSVVNSADVVDWEEPS